MGRINGKKRGTKISTPLTSNLSIQLNEVQIISNQRKSKKGEANLQQLSNINTRLKTEFSYINFKDTLLSHLS